MIFTENRYDRSMEQMMKGIPNFYPRGSGIVVTGNFRYTAEMCDCEYCGYYGGKKKGCLVPKCVCLEERISVGIASVKEIMTETMSEIKHGGFLRRLRRYIKESEAIFYAGNYTVKARFGSSTGIGGGYKGEASRCSGEGITIYGGTFNIETFQSGAAIGSGAEAYRSTGAIAIYGGSITASCHNSSAAIGGGRASENGPIYIYGGEVNAVAYGTKTGAGIGGGQDAEQGDPIYISGGTVISQSDKGAGMGG